MSNPITSCHQVPAVVVGGSEGTNHYECPVCRQWVDFEGNRLPGRADQELDEILNSFELGMLMPDRSSVLSRKEAKAALLALMYRENLAVIGDDLGEGDDETFAYYFNMCKAEQRQVAAKKYAQGG